MYARDIQLSGKYYAYELTHTHTSSENNPIFIYSYLKSVHAFYALASLKSTALLVLVYGTDVH